MAKTKAAAQKAAEEQKPPQKGSKGVSGFPTPETATIPIMGLLRGYHARRRAWAVDRRIYLGQRGGRGGGTAALMITGSRTGDLPWQRADDTDLLAEDWELIDPATGVEPVIE